MKKISHHQLLRQLGIDSRRVLLLPFNTKNYLIESNCTESNRNFQLMQYRTSQSSKNDISKYGGMNNKDWDQLWRDQSTPWDTKQPSPILRHLVETIYKDRTDIKHALVPGRVDLKN